MSTRRKPLAISDFPLELPERCPECGAKLEVSEAFPNLDGSFADASLHCRSMPYRDDPWEMYDWDFRRHIPDNNARHRLEDRAVDYLNATYRWGGARP